MRVIPYILAILNVILWGPLVWGSIRAMQMLAAQHIPDYPGSMMFYAIGIPVAVLAFSLVWPLWQLFIQKGKLSWGVPTVTLCLLQLYLIAFYGGGV